MEKSVKRFALCMSLFASFTLNTHLNAGYPVNVFNSDPAVEDKTAIEKARGQIFVAARKMIYQIIAIEGLYLLHLLMNKGR